MFPHVLDVQFGKLFGIDVVPRGHKVYQLGEFTDEDDDGCVVGGCGGQARDEVRGKAFPWCCGYCNGLEGASWALGRGFVDLALVTGMYVCFHISPDAWPIEELVDVVHGPINAYVPLVHGCVHFCDDVLPEVVVIRDHCAGRSFVIEEPELVVFGVFGRV